MREIYVFNVKDRLGFAKRNDTYFLRKFMEENNVKNIYDPTNCKNDVERRMVEFMLPIFYLDKSRGCTITMANTLYPESEP